MDLLQRRRRRRLADLRRGPTPFLLHFARLLHVDRRGHHRKLCHRNRGRRRRRRGRGRGIPVRQPGGDDGDGGGGFINGAMGVRINATGDEFPLDVGIPIVLNLVVRSSRQPPRNHRPSKKQSETQISITRFRSNKQTIKKGPINESGGWELITYCPANYEA